MSRAVFNEVPVAVRVPATSANLGPGFDALGLALELYDDIRVRTTSTPELTVELDGPEIQGTRRDEQSLVVRAVRTTFDFLEVPQPCGLAVRCTNRIPQGRGLGSSSAAIVAGVLAARAVLTDGYEMLDDRAALELAEEIEGHPDNVAACLLGGVTVAWKDADEHATARAVRLEPAKSWVPVVFVATSPVATSAARGLLPATVSHGDAARNAGRSALLVAALTGAAETGVARGSVVDSELLLAATEDRLHQEQRAPSMPPSWSLVRRLRSDGVPAVVSGAGPSVLALAPSEVADQVTAMEVEGFTTSRLEIDRNGAEVRRGAPTADDPTVDDAAGGDVGGGD